MSGERDWLQWSAPGTITGKSPGDEPSKPSKPAADALPEALLEAEPQAYEAGCQAWLVQRCVFLDRAWSGLGALHRDYCRWCSGEGNEVPAGRRTFRALLLAEGFTVTEHEMVYGLLLAEDLAEAQRLRRAAQQI